MNERENKQTKKLFLYSIVMQRLHYGRSQILNQFIDQGVQRDSSRFNVRYRVILYFSVNLVAVLACHQPSIRMPRCAEWVPHHIFVAKYRYIPPRQQQCLDASRR